jgi:hypothetical protein
MIPKSASGTLYLNHSENRARYRASCSCSSSKRAAKLWLLIRGEAQWRKLISHSTSACPLKKGIEHEHDNDNEHDSAPKSSVIHDGFKAAV